MMDMHSRNQYLQTLLTQSGYHLKTKKDKTKLLDEYCKATGQNRKYIIRKINTAGYVQDQTKTKQRNRPCYYNGEVVSALVRCWEIFDYPCGQRLVTSLSSEVDRLRTLGELACSDTVAMKLKKISSRTIDEKLTHEKEVRRLKKKYDKKAHPLLYQKIPVKVSYEQDRTIHGNLQIDCVEHCGSSTQGEYINTLSNTDIATGWWEGEACMGSGQKNVCFGLKKTRERYPYAWKEIHSDNGGEFINAHLYHYTQKEQLGFSRSRPYKKNDNCLVEQKNWTHVKKFVGYRRYDTLKEQDILNDLYRNELRLYKNYFQPVIKLISKERATGRIKRKYDTPETPYKRIQTSKEVSKKKKQELRKIYNSLNPAKLKRDIDKKLILLHRVYNAKQNIQQKNNQSKVESKKKLTPRMVTSYIAQPVPISVT